MAGQPRARVLWGVGPAVASEPAPAGYSCVTNPPEHRTLQQLFCCVLWVRNWGSAWTVPA